MRGFFSKCVAVLACVVCLAALDGCGCNCKKEAAAKLAAAKKADEAKKNNLKDLKPPAKAAETKPGVTSGPN